MKSKLANEIESIEYVPTCCGKKMCLGLRIGSLVQARCDVCGDTIYIKCKDEIKRPELLGD